MSLGVFGLGKVAQNDVIVVLSEAFVADVLTAAMGTCSACVDARC